MSDALADPSLRAAVRRVVALNLGYFLVKVSVAAVIGSVALFADSIDVLEDASVNLLILLALGWSAVWRARVGLALAAILLVPAIATLWTAWGNLLEPVAPAPVPLTLAGLGALAVNLACALMLARHRTAGGSLTRAAFLSARNDAAANLGMVLVGLVTAFIWRSAWPNVIVGLAIAALNADSAREVWQAARYEARASP